MLAAAEDAQQSCRSAGLQTRDSRRCNRFAEQDAGERLASLKQDARPGIRPLRDFSMRPVFARRRKMPPDATHWSTRSMAKAVGCEATVQQCGRQAAAPGRPFKLSNDPHFAEKLVDVVGLYLDPPEHALVRRFEKSQIQALDRTRKVTDLS
ncbi:MAG: hypothetical protein R3C02_09565 [Planctomycetaceae bacterium]